MWCRECAQDVPALPDKGTGYACARCGQRLVFQRPDEPPRDQESLINAGAASVVPVEVETAEGAARVASARDLFISSVDRVVDGMSGATFDEPTPFMKPLVSPPPHTLLDWQFEDTLRDVQATLRRRRTAPRRPLRMDAKRRMQPEWQVHAAHPNLPRPKRLRPAQAAKSSADSVGKTTHWLAWLLLWPGMTLLVCGGVLLGCAVWQNRDELWRIGVPLAVLGQTAVFFGVALLVERLWSQRASGDKNDSPTRRDDQDASRPATRRRSARRAGSRAGDRQRSTLADASHREAARQLDDLQARLDDLAERL